MPSMTEWPKLPELPKKLLDRLAKCLALVPNHELKAEVAPCVMGGNPPLPDGMDWPEREGKLLIYLGKIDTNAAHKLFAEVPAMGWLLFFYDDRDDDQYQTIIVTSRLGKPRDVPEDREYVTRMSGPDHGKVSSVAVCQLVPAFSYAYSSDSGDDGDEDIDDTLHNLMPSKAIGHLLGHSMYYNEDGLEHAVKVAASVKAGLNQPTKAAPEKPDSRKFACPELGKRLGAQLDSFKLSQADWKRRAGEKGKKWPLNFDRLMRSFFGKHEVAAGKMQHGEAMELAAIIEVCEAWKLLVNELESMKREPDYTYLHAWSKDFREWHAQVGEATEDDRKRYFPACLPGQEFSRSLHILILEQMNEHDHDRANRLEAIERCLHDLEEIAPRIDVKEMGFVFQQVVRVLHNHDFALKRQNPGQRAEKDVPKEKVDDLGPEEMAALSKQWRLLFAFDSELDYCWSDSGSVRYFIEETKLVKGEFDQVVSDIESG